MGTNSGVWLGGLCALWSRPGKRSEGYAAAADRVMYDSLAPCYETYSEVKTGAVEMARYLDDLCFDARACRTCLRTILELSRSSSGVPEEQSPSPWQTTVGTYAQTACYPPENLHTEIFKNAFLINCWITSTRAPTFLTFSNIWLNCLLLHKQGRLKGNSGEIYCIRKKVNVPNISKLMLRPKGK